MLLGPAPLLKQAPVLCALRGDPPACLSRLPRQCGCGDRENRVAPLVMPPILQTGEVTCLCSHNASLGPKSVSCRRVARFRHPPRGLGGGGQGGVYALGREAGSRWQAQSTPLDGLLASRCLAPLVVSLLSKQLSCQSISLRFIKRVGLLENEVRRGEWPQLWL